jgi:hypothetical protein
VDRRAAVTALLLLSALAGGASAQIDGRPTPEQYAEKKAAAERAPLFQTDDPLEMTLKTDISFLRGERSDSIEVDGTATFVDLNGSETTRPVKVRARGNFRRDRANCNFPPLRLNFPTGDMDGTVFEGQDHLKLVTPCQDNRDDYQRYIFDEYLAYKVLNLLTPASYRVRLVKMTYEDVKDDYGPKTKYTFLIESDDQMAERNDATYLDVPQMHPIMADAEQADITAMFNYMIGNLDWSDAIFHNAGVIETEDMRHLTVPYDFDFSGVVNTNYATVPPQLKNKVQRVRQRLFRGFCRPQLTQAAMAAVFDSKRDQIEQLYRSFPYYKDPGQAQDALDYYADFWKVVDNPKEFKSKIVNDCTKIPG